jgi:hypothetical protein
MVLCYGSSLRTFPQPAVFLARKASCNRPTIHANRCHRAGISVVCKVTWLRAVQLRSLYFDSVELQVFHKMSRLAVVSTEPPVQCVLRPFPEGKSAGA